MSQAQRVQVQYQNALPLNSPPPPPSPSRHMAHRGGGCVFLAVPFLCFPLPFLQIPSNSSFFSKARSSITQTLCFTPPFPPIHRCTNDYGEKERNKSIPYLPRKVVMPPPSFHPPRKPPRSVPISNVEDSGYIVRVFARYMGGGGCEGVGVGVRERGTRRLFDLEKKVDRVAKKKHRRK